MKTKQKRAYNRGYYLEYVYGLTPEDYNKHLLAQNNCCAICKEPFNQPPNYNKPCVDHNHITNKPRKLLCHSCNCMIGYSEESTLCLRNGADYLEKYTKHFTQ